MAKTVFVWIKVIIKILLIIVFIPFILIYLWLKITVYRFSFKRGLASYTLSGEQVKCLMSGAAKFTDILGAGFNARPQK